MNREPAIEHLREVNARIRRLIVLLPDDTIDTAPQRLSTLLSDISEIGLQLGNGSIRTDNEVQFQEVHEYQLLLEELQQKIPTLHSRFLAERASLERERGHLRATACWTDATLDTIYFK